VGQASPWSLPALREKYSRWAVLYGWEGNVHLLSVEMWSLSRALSRLPVDLGSYEERVREMMSKGVNEKQIVSFIRGERDRAESLFRRLEDEYLLQAVRSQHFKSLDELENVLRRLVEETRRARPRVSLSCIAEKGEGKVSVVIENPAPLPIEASVSLEGATPLKPAAKLRVNPRSAASWEARALIRDKRVSARVSYRVLGADIEGVVAAETQVEQPIALSQIYLNKPIDSFTSLPEQLKALRITVSYAINGWRILGHLGGGGFFQVFLAEREGFRAALKVPKGLCRVEKGDLLFFEAAEGVDPRKLVGEEAAMLRKVKEVRDSEGILHLVDFYESGVAEVRTPRGVYEVPYIALQYCPRGSLKDIAEKTRLSTREALIIALQVGTALQKCYERKAFLKHGDIKPENLLIDGEGRVVVTDFQTAVRWRQTMTSGALTPGYYHRAPDSRADVYALGRVLVDLVAGLEAPESSVPPQLRELVEEARSGEPPPMERFLEKIERVLWRSS
jgi:hypothetical protein